MQPVPVSPAEVRAVITRDGPQRAVAALMQPTRPNGAARFGSVENGIASGDQAWLDIYPLIRPGTDGETGLGVSVALSQALTANPAGVLRLMRESDDVSGVCQYAQMDPSLQQASAFYTRAIAAVEAINDPTLAQFRTVCLETLRSAQAQPAPATQ